MSEIEKSSCLESFTPSSFKPINYLISILTNEDMEVQYSFDSLRRDQNASPTQSPNKSNDHSQVNPALRQEWYPCSQGYSLRSYISHASNGPFFRPLLVRWQKLGCPSLSCLKGEDEMVAVQNALDKDGDEPWLSGDGSKNDLLTLCISQEKAITQAVKAFNENLPSLEKMAKKPFDNFAAQVGLYSSIEAELNRIEWNSDLDLTQLYQNAWQHVLNQFDRQRKGTCASRQDHKCLLDAVWGEACQWPLKALQYAFLGYTLALPKLDQKLPLEQSLTSNDSNSSVSNPTTVSASSSSMEFDYQLPNFHGDARLGNISDTSLGPADISYPVTTSSTGQVEDANVQNQHLSANHLLPSKPWLRKSFQELLFSPMPQEKGISFTNDDHGISDESFGPKKIIFEQRRPTLSDFWRFGGIPGMFHLPDLTPQANMNEDQDYFGFSTDESSKNHSTNLSKSPIDYEGTQPTHSSRTSTSTPRLQLQQSLSESQIAKIGPNRISITRPSRQSPTIFESNLHRPSLRARASTMNGEQRPLTNHSTEIDKNNSRKGDIDNKKRQKRLLGRQRYQRYYKRTMLQRQAMQKTIEQIKMEVENSVIDDTKDNIKNILNTPGKTHEELLEEYYSGLKADASTTTFDHKRMSKIRLRNIDVENITMISRLAKIVEEVPLNQLITILNGDRRTFQNAQGHGIPGIHSLLEAFMSQRDEWSALIAAEWRLLNGKTSSVRLMVRLLSLATDQEAPPDLNEESDLDNEEEESY